MYRCAGINLCFNTHRSRYLGSVPFFFSPSLNTILTRHMYCVYIRSVFDRCKHSSSPYWLWSDLLPKKLHCKGKEQKTAFAPKVPWTFKSQEQLFQGTTRFLQPVVCVISAPPSTTKTIVDPLTACFLLYLHVDMAKTQRTEKKPVYSFSKWWLT